MQSTLGMQIIMDGNGNYYRIDDKNQLVVATSREEASVFTFFEANQRIGGGPKSYFYHTIPAEDTPVTEEKFHVVSAKNEADVGKEGNENECDIAKYDWMEYLQKFCYLASKAGGRHNELTRHLSEVDQEICDIMHLVELYELTEDEELHAINLLKDSRQKRRDIKDEMTCLEYFQTSFGTADNITGAKNIIKQIKRLEHRVYHPRQLSEVFKNVRGRETGRSLYSKCSNEEKAALKEIDIVEIEAGTEGEDVMEYVRRETIYDTQSNDWLSFAKTQLDFFRNVPQYMMNLQLELNEIDCAIEETLTMIEDANYNVAQGYKAFKELKDLRNERKEKQKELQCLKVLTEELNCAEMEKTYQNAVNMVGNVLDE